MISQPFDVIFEIDDPNKALGLWYNVIMIVLNKHAPFIKKPVKRIHQPEWYNEDIREARIIRDHF